MTVENLLDCEIVCYVTLPPDIIFSFNTEYCLKIDLEDNLAYLYKNSTDCITSYKLKL